MQLHQLHCSLRVMSSFAIAVVMLGMLNESSQEKMIGIGRMYQPPW